MAILKSDAIVLKTWKLGETSKIVSLYTRDYGKIKVVAKGARDLKSKFKGCLEPLTCIRIVYYDKSTRDLQLLSHADLRDPHHHIVGDMQKTTLGLAAAELVDRVVLGDASLEKIFHLFERYLFFVDRGEGFLEAYFWYFQSHFIDAMGFKPMWERCLKCGASLGAGGGNFHPMAGGLMCTNCSGVQGGLFVHEETLEILYFLQHQAMEDAGKIDPAPAQKAEIRKIFDLYLKTHFEHLGSLRSLQFYYQLGMG